MNVKTQKAITLLMRKINEGQFYEAQQQTRVFASRFVKSNDLDSAINILYTISESLLKAGQGGSGGDLCLMLTDVYQKAKLVPDCNNKEKLITLLRLFNSDEPTRKKYIEELIGWSVKYGPYPAGDPDLHHVVGSIYAEEHDVYEAERHLILGIKDSAEILSTLEYEWYSQDDSHTAAYYASRAIFPYLLAGNVRDAKRSLQVFLSKLIISNPSITVQSISSNSVDVQIFSSLPLLNFLSLLLKAIQKGNPDIFHQLSSRYSSNIKEVGAWNETLTLIGELYFGVERPRNVNPLFDIMGSIFSGGIPAKPTLKRVGANETPEPIETLLADGLD